MKNRLFVNNNTIILFLFIIGSFLFIELNFRYWYRFLEQYMMFQMPVVISKIDWPNRVD